RRGLFASTYQSSVALGTLAVAGLISLLHRVLDANQMESFGWRIVFAVGGLVALGGIVLRRTLPETDRASAEERRAWQPFSVFCLVRVKRVSRVTRGSVWCLPCGLGSLFCIARDIAVGVLRPSRGWLYGCGNSSDCLRGSHWHGRDGVSSAPSAIARMVTILK